MIPLLDVLQAPAQRPAGAFARGLLACAPTFLAGEGAVPGPPPRVVESGWTAGRRYRVLARHEQLPLLLEVTCRPLDGFAAVELAATLRHDGGPPVPRVRDLHTLCLRFDLGPIGDPVVRSINGGTTFYYFPPRAFRVSEHTLLGGHIGGRLPLTIDSGLRGRSSQEHIPLFLAGDGDDRSGIYGGLAWSGDWQISFGREGGELVIRGGIWGADFTLLPGETIPFAAALLGFYEGSRDQGANVLRRCLRAHYLPTLGGERHLPPVYYHQWFQFQTRYDEHVLRAQVDACAELGVEYFEVDAGWYRGCGRHEPAERLSAHDVRRAGDFSAGVGNWLEVDPAVFPSGLDAFSAYVRSKGMRFGLWFEPERAALTSTLAREHPEWVLRIEPTAANRHLLAMAAPQHRDQIATHGLVDFGQPQVRAWMKEMFARMLEANTVRWIRWDFNMDPRLYWEVRDGPARRGISQIRHVQGVYEVLDWLRERFPDLFIDGCSSGGRRIDLGWLRRAHSYFSSDHTRHRDIVRNHLSGGNRFLPANWLETNVARSARHGAEAGPPFDEADYTESAFQSRFAGTFGISDDVAAWPPALRARARRHIEVYKQLRSSLAGDFYPLFPLPLSLDAWDGWQFHDPESDQGFVAAFRLRSRDDERHLRLHGLDPARTYAVVDPYSGETVATGDGTMLMGTGLPVSLPRDGSLIRTYRAL